MPFLRICKEPTCLKCWNSVNKKGYCKLRIFAISSVINSCHAANRKDSLLINFQIFIEYVILIFHTKCSLVLLVYCLNNIWNVKKLVAFSILKSISVTQEQWIGSPSFNRGYVSFFHCIFMGISVSFLISTNWSSL